MFETIKILCDLNGVSGRESAVADTIGFNPLFIAMGFFDLIGAVFLIALIAERRNSAKREHV